MLVAWRRALDGAHARRADDPDVAAANLFRRRYWAIVAAEAALLAIGFIAIWGIGAPSQTYLAWTALIVGLHFIAFRLTGVWRGGIMAPAALLILFGVAGLALATFAADWIPLVSGVLSGFTLLGGSFAVAVRQAWSRPTTSSLRRDGTTRARTGATAARRPHAR